MAAFRIVSSLLSFIVALAGQHTTGKERPIMKVVRMLQDMSVELQKEIEDDKKVHEMLTCWCESNEKEKAEAIEMATAKMAQLEASTDEAVAKIAALKEKREATRDEINADHKALTEANELRIKENQAYQAESSDLMEAIAACKQAIVVLGKHNTDFAQVQSVARRLQNARAAQKMLSVGGLQRYQLDALKAFLRRSGNSASFLAIPGFQSYAPQTGQIFGVLQQMQEDFEKDLSDSDAAELKAKKSYETLKAAKEEEIKAGEAAIVQLDQDIAEFTEKHAQETKEYEDTQAQLELDQTFLANLKKQCAESAAEYEARVKSRTEEIAAVSDTIKILNDESAYDVFDKSVNTAFIQTSATNGEEQQRKQRARIVLQAAADKTKSSQLALLAITSQLDAFEKVKAEIDKLVAELTKQQADEVAQRDWCIDEFAKNNRSTTEGYDKKTALETKIADLTKTIETLTNDIDSAKTATAEMEDQMKRASETREAENADYQETIADQRLTQQILLKATDRMKQVYAFFLQQQQQRQPGAPHIATSGNHTAPGNGPARFTKYEQNAGGARVIALLESVMADSKKTEDEAIASEEDSQTAYENFMKDSNKSIMQNTESITSMSDARAAAKESLTMAETDLKQTVQTLAELSETNGDLHKSCDFMMDNFEARQEARAAEMDALNEAKAILSGMK